MNMTEHGGDNSLFTGTYWDIKSVCSNNINRDQTLSLNSRLVQLEYSQP